jgi:hypothetical protein
MAKSAVTHRPAVLIDADNASPQIAPGLFAAAAKLGHATVRRIFGDFSGTRLKGWAEILAAHAIVPQQAFANTPGKNASDIALVIDAMDLLPDRADAAARAQAPESPESGEISPATTTPATFAAAGRPVPRGGAGSAEHGGCPTC